MNRSLWNSTDYEKLPVAPGNEDLKRELLKLLRGVEADLVNSAIAAGLLEQGVLQQMLMDPTSNISRLTEECVGLKILLDMIVLPSETNE